MFQKNYWAFDKIYETLFKIWKIIYNIKKLFIVFSQETFRVGLTVILGNISSISNAQSNRLLIRNYSKNTITKNTSE